MKLLIDVDEKLVCKGFERTFTEEEKDALIRAIGNGTPLPEIYGRLGDLDELEQRISNFIEYHASSVDETTLIYERFILDGIKDTHTIIEANKESEE